MRKTLLSLAIAALACGNAYSMYLIGEPAGEWKPSVGIEMTETAEGWEWTGTVAPTSYFAFATQLDPTDNWDNFNGNYRLSPATDGTTAAEGIYDLLLGGQGAAFKGCGSECVFLITKDGDKYSLKVTPKGESPVDPPVEPTVNMWSVIGGFNSWAGDADMTELNKDVWAVRIPELSGEFKFRADHNWDIDLGTTDTNPVITEDGVYPAVKQGRNFNIGGSNDVTLFLQPEAELVTVRFNVGEATPLALRGGMNEWNWTPMYCLTKTKDEGVYMLTIQDYKAGTAFKIADYDWGNQYTAEDKEMVAGGFYPLIVDIGSSTDMAFAEDYASITIYLDTKAQTMQAVKGEDSVGSIEAAEGEAVYYNLQGVKVQNPERGIFIRVANGRTQKVVK